MILQHDLSIVAAADLLQALGTTVPTSATAKRKYIRAIQDLTAIMAGQQASQPPIARQMQEWKQQVRGWDMLDLQGWPLHQTTSLHPMSSNKCR
jgi:hypothetical protein